MAVTGRDFIAGDWRAGEIENRNPSDLSDLIGVSAQAGAQDLDDALAAARAGQRDWARTGLEAHQTALDAIGRELMARGRRARQAAQPREGTPLAEGRGEVTRAGQFFTYYTNGLG